MEDWSAADIFGALAHPTRVRLLRLLMETGDNGMAAGALAKALGMAPSTLSHHLAALELQGLIKHQRRQRSLIYRVNDAQVRALISFLVNDCCGGDPQRCGFSVSDLVPSPC
jgi:DNA-binding transcriptional ArsR family regulator